MAEGLRERKKQKTRELLAETARRLFAERGFEQVTVTEIAHEAEVSPATVFNYFPTKEDLFYSRLEAFEDELLDAIRYRARNESVIDAFAGFLLGQGGVLTMDSPEADEQLRTITRIITESPALLARERQVFDRYAQTLAALLAEETEADPHDVVPGAVARSLLGLHRALIDEVRREALAGTPVAAIRPRIQAGAEQALAQLRHGLADYGAS
jgi:AcrR family transcriptional regulator